MCKHLVKIKNPNFNKRAYGQEYGNLVTVNPNLVPRDEYIEVPCGKCSECRQRYINSIIQRAIVESLSSYVYFITLTYDNKHLPYIDLNGERFFYADYDDIQLMFKRFREHKHIHREFRYLCVNEYGDKKHRPHFHILLFVGKQENDDENTPHFIREVLFQNLGNYFSKNVGTRKNPIYEKLFTYQVKNTVKGIKTNYYVKYVESDDLFTIVNNDFIPKDENVKSIRYLVGYVNKPSKYEQKIDCIIDSYKDDNRLYLKLRHLLKSQLRFSKGFGCGFTDGKKFYLEPISVRCSSNVHCYTEIVDSLPKTYEEFCDLYPEFNIEILEWRDRDFYQHFSSWKRCLNGMTADEYMYHCVYLKYFKEEFNSRYNRYRRELQPKISNYFDLVNKDYTYSFSTVHTTVPKETPLFRYLRDMVEESINKGLPFIAFKMVGNQRYTPMCKYYKDRVTTFDDTYRLYERLGVKNYEEWVQLFEKSLSNKKAVVQLGNEFKYFNDDEIGEDVQLMNKSDVLYNTLFTNCN